MVTKSWPRSLSAWEHARRTLGGGVSSGLRATMKPHPLFFERGSGSRLWDVDGNEYLDYVLGWGPVILGHAHPRLVDAVVGQMSRGQTFGSGHRWEYEVAEQLCEAIPGMDRVLWTNTGTEANQIALRLARAMTGRRRFVKFGGHYHGWSDAMLIGYRPGTDGGLADVASRGQHPRVLDDVTVATWNDIGSVKDILGDPANDICAVFAEPVLCNSGVLAPEAGFLSDLRRVCDATGTLLVFDEVITGFRIAYGGGTERFGVRPDLVVLAKALAGGMPLAAVAGRVEIIDQTQQGVVHAGTYNGNPVSLAAAAATLSTLREPGVYDRFEALASDLVVGAQAAFDSAGVAATVHHVGPVVQIVPGQTQLRSFDDYLAGNWAFYDRLTVELLRRGVFTLPGGRWYLSTSHSQADVAQTIATLTNALGTTLRSTAADTAEPNSESTK